MAANKEIGNLVAKVTIDSTGFQNGISKINKDLKVVQSEFQLASSKIGNFGKGTDSLKVKSESLSKQIELQKQKVQALSDSFNKSVETKGKDATATKDLEIKVNKASAELNKMQSELTKTNKELSVQTSGWTKLSKSLDTLGSKMKKIGEGVSSTGKKLSTTLTLPIVGAGVASVKLASDMNESINKVDVAFDKSSDEVKKWSNNTLKSFGIAKGTALDMAAGYGDMATSMGLPTNAAANMSEKLVGLAGDLASFKNINIGEANTALTSIFTGETESLKKLGIVMTQTNLEAYALKEGLLKSTVSADKLKNMSLKVTIAQENLAKKVKKYGTNSLEAQKAQLSLNEALEKQSKCAKGSFKDLSEAEKVQIRYKYVLDMTKNAQGDFIRTGGGTANQMRIFSESLKELGATIGEKILPVITPIIKKTNEWVQAFGKLDDGTKKTIIVIAGIVAAIGPLLIFIGHLITAVGSIVSVFSAASGAIAAAGGIIAIITGPIGITIGVIAGLISIGVLLYKNWDKIKETAFNLGNGIKDTFGKIGTGIFNTWNNAVKKTTETWGAIQNSISKHGGGIKGIIGAGMEGYLNIWKSGFNLMDKVSGGKLSAIKNGFSNAWNGIKSIGSKVKSTLSDMFNFKIPHISLPHIEIKGKLSLNPPQIPSIGVKWYDRGGIFNSPSVIGVGEKRPEFVGALEDLRYLIRDELKNQSNGNYQNLLHVDKVEINNDMDIEALAEKLEFYRKQKSLGIGGAY